MPSHSTKALQGRRIAARYELARPLARGGMGTVWAALDSKLGRRVAVKIMDGELAEHADLMNRFEREALVAAQLRSAHVVQVFDYGIDANLPYIVMELLDGESLSARLKREGALGLSEVGDLVMQVARGLKEAHSQGLVHRDLKPGNIFLTTRDDERVIKLLDFGVVKAVDRSGASEETATGVVLGTPQYMSPEQTRGTRSIDLRSDLWSMGVVVFRALTGQNPFRGETIGDAVLKICSDEIPRPRDYNSNLPAELDVFFVRALARKPEERFQSAMELADAFGRICAKYDADFDLRASLSGPQRAASMISELRLPGIPLAEEGYSGVQTRPLDTAELPRPLVEPDERPTQTLPELSSPMGKQARVPLKLGLAMAATAFAILFVALIVRMLASSPGAQSPEVSAETSSSVEAASSAELIGSGVDDGEDNKEASRLAAEAPETVRSVTSTVSPPPSASAVVSSQTATVPPAPARIPTAPKRTPRQVTPPPRRKSAKQPPSWF